MRLACRSVDVNWKAAWQAERLPYKVDLTQLIH